MYKAFLLYATEGNKKAGRNRSFLFVKQKSRNICPAFFQYSLVQADSTFRHKEGGQAKVELTLMNCLHIQHHGNSAHAADLAEGIEAVIEAQFI